MSITTPCCPKLSCWLTVEFLRGLEIIGPLRAEGHGAENLLEHWLRVIRRQLDQPVDVSGRTPTASSNPALRTAQGS